MLSQELNKTLEEKHGPIKAFFKVTDLPDGAAPVHIRENWVVLDLPVRARNLSRFLVGYLSTSDGPVYCYEDSLSKKNVVEQFTLPVCSIEAIDTLREAGKTEAAEFWTPHSAGFLIFRRSQGELKYTDIH